MRASFEAAEPGEMQYCLGQILEDSLDSHSGQIELRKVEKIYLIVQALDVAGGGWDIDQTRQAFGEEGIEYLRQIESSRREWLKGIFAAFSRNQAVAICGWLECASHWPELKEDKAAITSALSYWKARAWGD